MVPLNISPDSLYDKTFTCLVCESDFKSKSVRSNKSRLISKDTDFMPRYVGVNPLFYDVVICPHCGYSALTKYFDKIKQSQAELIKSNITSKYKPRIYPPIYDVDIAIERHKIALLNAMVKKAKVSEEAYICLKISWLFRIKEDSQGELKFLRQAHSKFMEAYEKESPPIAGMDIHTVTYLIGELARRIGSSEEALLWFSRVILARGVNSRLKELARDQKDLIKSGDL